MLKHDFLAKNKKASEQIISIYWFAILFITAAAVVYMVYTFYSYPYDVRELEANVLINKAADCISTQGKLNSNVIEAGKFKESFKSSFLESCKLNFNSEEIWKDELQYYTGIEIFDGTAVNSPVYELEAGNLNLISSCEIKNDDYGRIAKCVKRRFYATSEGDKQYLVEITGIIKKGEKNAK